MPAETLDTMYPYYRLQEAGFEPVVAAPEKRRYQMVMHEVKPGWTITKEWEGYTIEADIAFADVEPEEYAGILFSGGRAPEYIRYDEDLVRITKHFFETNKPVASVCHGVEIPAYADCVRGDAWPRCPSANSISKSAAGFSSTSRASSTATWSAAEPFTTTATMSVLGSKCCSTRRPVSSRRPDWSRIDEDQTKFSTTPTPRTPAACRLRASVADGQLIRLRHIADDDGAVDLRSTRLQTPRETGWSVQDDQFKVALEQIDQLNDFESGRRLTYPRWHQRDQRNAIFNRLHGDLFDWQASPNHVDPTVLKLQSQLIGQGW